MIKHATLLSALSLLVAPGASGGEAPPEVRVRVAAALALATLERPEPIARAEQKSVPAAKRCGLCSESCACGCAQTGVCLGCRILQPNAVGVRGQFLDAPRTIPGIVLDNRRVVYPAVGTAPAALGVMVPTYQPYRPAYQPVQFRPAPRFQPRTVFRANCGPGG